MLIVAEKYCQIYYDQTQCFIGIESDLNIYQFIAYHETQRGMIYLGAKVSIDMVEYLTGDDFCPEQVFEYWKATDCIQLYYAMLYQGVNTSKRDKHGMTICHAFYRLTKITHENKFI